LIFGLRVASTIYGDHVLDIQIPRLWVGYVSHRWRARSDYRESETMESAHAAVTLVSRGKTAKRFKLIFDARLTLDQKDHNYVRWVSRSPRI